VERTAIIDQSGYRGYLPFEAIARVFTAFASATAL
jgi:hypothetical protein